MRGVMALALAAAVGCGAKDTDRGDPAPKAGRPAKDEPRPDGPIVEAADLRAAYAADSVAASAKYAGRPLRVRVRVDEVEPAGGEWIWVGQKIESGGVRTRIPSTMASQLSKGSHVVVRSGFKMTADDGKYQTIILADAEAVTVER